MDQRIIAGRYALEVEIGRGAMGVVWRAQDSMIDRPVAIKELHLAASIPGDQRLVLEERILREARTAGRLNDPAVVTVHDILTEGDHTYIVMEMVDAANLAKIIAERGPLNPRWVADIARQALSALECAHTAGVVHRDVKPSNLMVCPDGRVKLTDFGIAQSVDDPRLTTMGELIGSPAYIAPERLQGWEASPASDLWSLGVTLAHALEGRNPYERATTASTLHAVMNERPVLRNSSGPLAHVLAGLLLPDPSQRMTSQQARAILSGAAPEPLPTQSQPIRKKARSSKSRRRGKMPAAAAIGTAVTVAAGLTLTLMPSGKVPTPAAVQESTTSQQPVATSPAASAPESTATDATSQPTTTGNSVVSEGKLVEDKSVVTFGREAQIPGWGLSGTQCAVGFLRERVPVTTAAECGQPHDIQLYAAATPFWDKKQPVPYPGVDWLRDFAQKYCSEQFKSNLIVAPAGRAALAYAVLIPTATEWNARTDTTPGFQEVLCVLWNRDRSQLSKSVIASG